MSNPTAHPSVAGGPPVTAIPVIVIGPFVMPRIETGVQDIPFQYKIVLPSPAAQPWVLSWMKTELRVVNPARAGILTAGQESPPPLAV